MDDLYALEADLRGVAVEAGPNLEKAIEVTARNIKDDWATGATVSRGYAATYAAAIDYTMYLSLGEIAAEIGPSLGRTSGASAGFLEDAPGGVRAAPQHAGRDALEKNQQDFVDGLGKAIVGTFEKHNL